MEDCWIWEPKAVALRPGRAAAMHETLGLDGTPPKDRDNLPRFWHHIYFWDPQPPKLLGRDSHPKTGIGLIPDLGLPQRMWAGGALEFHAPVVLGQAAQKITTVENVQIKQGRTGKLGFVTLNHEIRQDQHLCVTERQDIVYREPPYARQSNTPRIARTDEVAKSAASFDSTLLFRYSALTFNGHRIHYDVDYCREVEGYSGLVVHGPLLAQHLIRLAEQKLGNLSRFEFRATSALFHTESAEFCLGSDKSLWVRAADGRLCMQASANA